jgi:hypothetical protein
MPARPRLPIKHEVDMKAEGLSFTGFQPQPGHSLDPALIAVLRPTILASVPLNATTASALFKELRRVHLTSQSPAMLSYLADEFKGRQDIAKRGLHLVYQTALSLQYLIGPYPGDKATIRQQDAVDWIVSVSSARPALVKGERISLRRSSSAKLTLQMNSCRSSPRAPSTCQLEILWGSTYPQERRICYWSEHGQRN